jgi:superoxide dismutase, Fe-Mn family
MERRKFITVVGASALATPLIGSFASCAAETKTFEGHKFPELGYDYNALEPYIDAQTMELHYSKHHKGYFDKFLAAADGTELLNTPMEEIFTQISKQPEAVRNNGGGYYNHTLFWENMTPAPVEIPANLRSALEKDFGSVDSFKEQFSNAAKTHFGSGWAWLAIDNSGKLIVTSTPNQDNPLMDVASQKGHPLLAIDVWEHAYYLKYQNRRAEYVDNFWNIVNWETVGKRLAGVNSSK